jgi:hypothetical protein
MADRPTQDRFKDRFDGAAAWAGLTPEQQAAIGAVALEIIVNWNGCDAYEDRARTRPFEAADPLLLDRLHGLVDDAIPATIVAEPVPSLLGQVCRRCGCSQEDACADGCAWAEDDLCTACAGARP